MIRILAVGGSPDSLSFITSERGVESMRGVHDGTVHVDPAPPPPLEAALDKYGFKRFEGAEIKVDSDAQLVALAARVQLGDMDAEFATLS